MKENQILIIIKEPGKAPEIELLFENTLQAFQAAVGGPIEVVTVDEHTVLVCNEEGRLRQLPYNGIIAGIPFVGTVLAVGVKDEEFTSVRGSHIPRLLRMMEGRE